MVDTVADSHYRDKAKLAMALAELLNQEAHALDAQGVDVIQFDEPAFNVYMDDVKHRGSKHCTGDRRTQVPDRGSHLLRLRHTGQHRLEEIARKPVAAVPGDFSSAGEKPARPGFCRAHEFACAE